MKTFARLIRRYVLATAAVVLVAAALCLGAVAYIGLHYGNVEQDRTGIETLAGALTQTAGGLLIACDPEDADALFEALKPAVPSAQRVGTVQPYTGGARIYLK